MIFSIGVYVFCQNVIPAVDSCQIVTALVRGLDIMCTELHPKSFSVPTRTKCLKF